jgi:hypothetical protein
MPHLVKRERPAPPPFTAEQAAWIEERIAQTAAHRDGIFEAIYRACVGVARAIRPDKKWDGL